MQESRIAAAIVIPAFRPDGRLGELVEALRRGGAGPVVVVDDGSGPGFAAEFARGARVPGVRVLRHEANMGKGAALKTGFAHVLTALPESPGAVTADADGQHDPRDVLAVARRLEADPEVLVLGARRFEGAVPARSRAGNAVARWAVAALAGQSLTDTQTGLRGIPRALLAQLARIGSNGYEFELDMLIACKHLGLRVAETPIRTIYREGNRSSHFDPLRDSMRISFVLLRFTAIALATAGIDNLCFLTAYAMTGSLAGSQIAGRLAALTFNYSAVRRAVFLSGEKHSATLPKYLLAVACGTVLSYAGIVRLGLAGVGTLRAKAMVESALFLANFVVQRDFVFTKKGPARGATDWDRYYRSVPLPAKLTRTYTARILTQVLQRFAGLGRKSGMTIVELGGANSCFLDAVLQKGPGARYHIVDTNALGLELARLRRGGRGTVEIHQRDVREPSPDFRADVVFSVGLIEHFNAADTRRAIQAHFDGLKHGGYAVISFPTPTALYRAARWLAESTGLWRFPDERPLERAEVAQALRERGEIVYEKTLWPLVFTQRLMVARKAA